MKEVPKGSPLEKGILTFFYGCWGRQAPVFPGPLPVSIERQHFSQLRNNKYLVCEKTDGTRNVIVCFMFEGKKHTAILDRALNIWTLNIQFPKKAHLGTLLDGEMLPGGTLLVYDAVWVNGENVSQLNFLERYEKMEHMCKGIMRLAKDPITVKVKKFEVLEKFQYYLEEVVPKLEHATDGFIFTPVNEPIRLGTHETMFKWKPLEKNTIDFQAKWHPFINKWGLYIQDKGKLIFETEYYGPFDVHEDDILECEYKGPGIWIPLAKRTDKNYPNNRRTFYRTLVNIKEDIKVKEFYSFKL